MAVETPDVALPNALITATQKKARIISRMPKRCCRVIRWALILFYRLTDDRLFTNTSIDADGFHDGVDNRRGP